MQADREFSAKNVPAMQCLAGHYADAYIRTFLVEPVARALRRPASADEVRNALSDPVRCLFVFFQHYAFARRGRERDDLTACACSALNHLAEAVAPAHVLETDDHTRIWEKFVAACANRGVPAHEPQNRGPVQGVFELAAEIHGSYPGLSIAAWVVEAVRRAEVLEPEHARIVDIRGVGPKTASTFIRDVVVLYGIEEDIHPAERIYMLAVDRWLRMALPHITTEPELGNAPDWIVAGKVARYTRAAGVSACRFDMGVTYFGQRVVGSPDRFEQEFAKLGSVSSEPKGAPKPA